MPHSALIQPWCSRRCSGGYSEPWLTWSTSRETCCIRSEIDQPCMEPLWSVRRIRRSSVPCKRSIRGGCGIVSNPDNKPIRVGVECQQQIWTAIPRSIPPAAGGHAEPCDGYPAYSGEKPFLSNLG